MNCKYKTITVFLLILWIISIVGFYSYFTYQSIVMGLPTTPDLYLGRYIPFAISFFYLFPLTLLIRKYSKLAQMKVINRIANIFALLYGFASFIAPLAMCAANLEI